MLSIIDIKTELGKNIYLYPIHSESIKGNTIDLHASEFGWSFKTNQKLNNGKGYLVIPPHDLALIYTEESIYVSHKIGGTLHSKVTLVSKGLSHVSTTLDPQYRGTLLIAIYNYNDTSFPIQIGSEFVSLIFHYLSTPGYQYTNSHDNDPGHPRMIENMDGKDDYIMWRDQHKWSVREDILYETMINSSDYKKCKENFAVEQRKFNRKYFFGKLKQYAISLLIAVIVLGLLSIIAFILDWGTFSLWAKSIIENFALPLLVSLIVAQIVIDVRIRP